MYSGQQSALTTGARPASQTEEFCKSISNEIANLHEKINIIDGVLQRYKAEPQPPNDRGMDKSLAPPDRLSEFSKIHSEVSHANERLSILYQKNGRTFMSGFKQFRLEGIGIVSTVKGGGSTSRHTEGSDRHPYMKNDFWQNKANQFWNSSLYSEESRIDLAKRANVVYP